MKNGMDNMIGERVLYLRYKILHLTQKEFGAEIGIKAKSVSRIERGETKLTKSLGMLICQKWYVRPEWLWYNEGEIFSIEQPGLELKKKYENLDPRLKKFVDMYIDAIIENQENLLK